MSYTNGLDKPTDYFNTKLYTQNASTNAITGVGFQPDWTWIKNRDSANRDHRIFDSVRGANKPLKVNGTNAEVTETDTLNSFDTDGFTLGADTQGYGVNDLSGNNTVSWNWLASNTTASNTDGSVTSTVSANTTAGFSICKFTNPSSAINFTFGHGLGVAPRMFIMKGLNTSNWQVYHESMGNTNMIQLNYSNAKSSAANWWNSTSPSSTVCTVGSDFVETSQDSIAYVFAEKKGYSKFGSYTGNGNADGTFIYTGFKPAFVIIKNSSRASENWNLIDNKRDGFNGSNENLAPNLSGAESSGNNRWDILSNGFKCRDINNEVNGSGDTYIYMAFAENPFVTGASGIPTTAR